VSGKPTDDTIALVAFLLGRGAEWQDRWFYADEIRAAIGKLGFRQPTIQWVTARLIAMTKEDAPRFERRTKSYCDEYRVTHWAATGLSNNWRGFSLAVPR